MAEADLLLELCRREMSDLRADFARQIEELHVANVVLIERVAELEARATREPEPAPEPERPAEESPAAAEDEALEEELEAEGEDAAVVEEITELNDEIAETYEEETRPERMFWLHRRIFARREA